MRNHGKSLFVIFPWKAGKMRTPAGGGEEPAGSRRSNYLQNVLWLICTLAVGQMTVMLYLEGGPLAVGELDAVSRERLAMQIRTKAAKVHLQKIEQLDSSISALSAKAQAASHRVHATSLQEATRIFHQNRSSEPYADLQSDLKKLQAMEDKLVRASEHELIEQLVSKALEEDRRNPIGRALPALGAANEWLSVLHRLTDSGRVRGLIEILELLTRLLALEPDSFVELSAGGPQPGVASWEDSPPSDGEAQDIDLGVAGRGGGGGGRGSASWGVAHGVESVPVIVESPAMYMREHRLWRAASVRHVHARPLAAMPAILQRHCRRAGSTIDMCRVVVAPHNVKVVLATHGMQPGKTGAILASHTGVSDLYLLRAALHAGFLPAVITAAYNRNFQAQDAYAMLPELAGAASLMSGGAGGASVWWASDCYFGASALALQRTLQHFAYTLVAEDGQGSVLVFVRNDLLPSGKAHGAHLPALMSANWVSKVVKNVSALHAPCPRRLWVRVSEGAGGGPGAATDVDRVLLEHEAEVQPLKPSAAGGAKDASVLGDGGAWAQKSTEYVAVVRRWKVVGEGAAAGWAGSGGGSDVGCRGDREVSQHVGSLVRRAGVNGSAVWSRAVGNAMVEREARLRELNHNLVSGGLGGPSRLNRDLQDRANRQAETTVKQSQPTEPTVKERPAGSSRNVQDRANRDRFVEGSNRWCDEFWQPSLSCPVINRLRGQGGAWAVCDAHRMRKCGCVIYTMRARGTRQSSAGHLVSTHTGQAAEMYIAQAGGGGKEGETGEEGPGGEGGEGGVDGEEEEWLGLHHDLVKLLPQCQVHAFVANSVLHLLHTRARAAPATPRGLYLHALPPLAPNAAAGGGGDSAYHIKPYLLVQAASLMLGHAHLGSDLHTAIGLGKNAGQDPTGARGRSGSIAGAVQHERTKTEVQWVRGNTDGRLDLMVLDMPEHDVEIIDSLSRDQMLARIADQILVATGPVPADPRQPPALDGSHVEDLLTDLTETVTQLRSMAAVTADAQVSALVLNEVQRLEQLVADRQAGALRGEGTHTVRAARRIAHLARLLHANSFAVIGREHATLAGWAGGSGGGGGRGAGGGRSKDVNEVDGLHVSLASRDFMPF